MKWLVKTAFLVSTIMIIPIALSAQQNSAPDMLGIGEKLGVQQQKITTLEQAFKESQEKIDKRFESVDKRFDEFQRDV